MPDEGERVKIELAKLPAGGMHLLQVQNPGGLASNDFIFHVVKDAAAAVALQQAIDRAHVDIREKLANAIAGGDMSAVKRTLGRRARRINERNPRSGSTPLSTAALHGRLKMARYLLQRGARVDRKNRDGNTPLHVAAFLCRDDVVKLLLDKGASPNQKNARGETPVDVVSSAWNDGLADFYRAIGRSTKQKLDLDQIRRKRPQIAAQLRSAAKRADPSKGMQP